MASREGKTAEINKHIGARIRERRIALGYTQQHFAELIGVTYQQTHKYELGINRITAGRLLIIAQVLAVPVSYFYEGMDDSEPRTANPHERMTLELARNFAGISNERHRIALIQLARALSNGVDPDA